MAVDRLPGRVREFASYLDGLIARLDPGGGWCAVFWQRDPEGMRACLDGREVPPWDVVEALLEDLGAAYGPAAAAAERQRAGTLHATALTAYDARPGAREALADRLDVMLREQRYAAERQAELNRLLAAPATPEEAESLRLDLAWAHDDHERATARCAELRSRMAQLDRRAAPGRLEPEGGRHGLERGAEPGALWAGEGHAVVGEASTGPTAPFRHTGPAAAHRAGGPAPEQTSWPTGPARHSGPAPHAGPAAAGLGGPGPSSPPGVAAALGPAGQSAAPVTATGPGSVGPSVPPAVSAVLGLAGEAAGPAAGPGSAGPAAGPGSAGPSVPPPAAAPPAGMPPAPKARKRRRGSARFAGMAEEEGASVAVPQAPVPVVPESAAGRPTPRGARFAGGASSGEPVPVPVEAADDGAGEVVDGVVERLVRLRGEGRSGEAHVLLVEATWWPAARLPLLADALHRAGLDADWTTLLWEAAALPAERLVAAADALAAAGRGADGQQMLRQGVARPAEQIGTAVLRLDDEGRRRDVRALLDAYVRVRPPEEAARSVAADPDRLVPLLLEVAHAVSDERYWDLVHALRVAGHAP
ncbi:hypothetical protein [Streptomyces sp. NPDC048521]|uniref:hypothetical protein n=1 Tax=Streptomyces sp. NPDC048521 TaxID=3365566 RepID=UPI00371BA827